MVEVEIEGLKVLSEMNLRQHWRKRAARFREQKMVVWYFLSEALKKPPLDAIPCTVTLTRIGPRKLDSDNLAGGFKAIRDEVARWMGINDNHPDVVWAYQQVTSKEVKVGYSYRVRIKIERDTPTQP